MRIDFKQMSHLQSNEVAPPDRVLLNRLNFLGLFCL